MIKKIITSLLLILCFSNNSFSKSPPPGTGTASVPANILIMLDNSGSMGWDIDGSIINASSSKIALAADVAVDSSGNLYALEVYTRKIKVFNSSGTYQKNKDIGGGYGYGCNQWIYAYDIAIHNDTIYVLDYYGRRIITLSLTGQCLKQKTINYYWTKGLAVSDQYIYVGYGMGGGVAMYDRATLNHVRVQYNYTEFYRIYGLDVNDAGTKLVTANYTRHKVCVHTISGSSLGSCTKVGVSSQGTGNGYFYYPSDAVFDSSGNVFVTELYGHRIQKFDTSYAYVSKYGSFNYNGNPFFYPYGLGISSNDNIYAADFGNNLIQEFTSTLSYVGRIGVNKSRMQMAKAVIKKLVSNTELTSGANFGLMEWGWYWNPYLRLRVPVSSNGAKLIFNDVDQVRAYGGTYLLQAMNKAREYYTGSQSPRIANAKCQLNYIILISDGVWNSHGSAMSVVKSMKDQYGIKTFAVGFAIASGNKNNYEDLADNGGTDDPLYADNEGQLLTTLTDAIKQAISGTLTYTTPAVMSEKQRGNYIYQSTFKYSTSTQWEGHLKKIRLNTNGSFGATQWDAADRLNKKSYTSRNLWTAGISAVSTNNFTTTNRDELKKLLFPNTVPTDTEVDNLINFIRGIDTYDEDDDNNTTETRHKLADIYHSDLVVVGPPEGSTENDSSSNFTKKDAYYRSQNNYNGFKNGTSCGGSCQSRKEVVIAGSNGGILHAFDTSNGEELWGYIPPNILGKLSTMVSSKANTTNAIYGIDGSPVVKDIYFDDTPNNSVNDPRWRTILLSGLGAGGHGYFALDITDINSPKQLFTIEHDPFRQFVNHWDSDEKLTKYAYELNYSSFNLNGKQIFKGNMPDEYDYQKLGEAWSTPRIIRIKVNNKDRWVAVFGGGYNGGTNPNYGSTVYVMDLENEGKLLKTIYISDEHWTKHNYACLNAEKGSTEFDIGRSCSLHSLDTNSYSLRIQGLGNVPYSLIGDRSGNRLRNMKLKFETTDANGNLVDVPLENRTHIYISVVPKSDIVNSVPSDLVVITADGTEKADYDGALVYAADLEGKITKINLTGSNASYETTTLFNAESTTDNGRYIYNQPEAAINEDKNLWLYFGTGNTQKLGNRSNQIKNRVYGIKDKDFPNFSKINSPGTVRKCSRAPSCPGGYYDLGWFVDLKESRKVTAEPTVFKDRVYFPLYEPAPANAVCTKGSAYLNAYDRKCGAAKLGTYGVKLGQGVLSKVLVQGDNIYIGLSGEADTKGTGFTASGNLITGKSKATSGKGGVQLEGWKENY